MKLTKNLKIALILGLTTLIYSCGVPAPKMKRKIKFYIQKHADEACRIANKNESCVFMDQSKKAFKCLTVKDRGVYVQYIESLIHGCAKWSKSPSNPYSTPIKMKRAIKIFLHNHLDVIGRLNLENELEIIYMDQEKEAYGCLTSEDLGVLEQYIETLIRSCKRWR